MDRSELIQRLKEKKNPDFLSITFEKQKDFLLNKCTQKVMLCPRRAGKSYAVGIALLIVAFKYPGSTSLFVSMSNKTCQRILFKNILQPLIKIFNLEDKVRLVKGSDPKVEFSNGSEIFLFGVDSAEDKKDDLLGQKNMLVVIDEAQDISTDVNDLINRVLIYTIADNIDKGAQIIMCGTPSPDTNTYFYNITKDYKSSEGWEYFSWSGFDNPHMIDNLKKLIEKQKIANPQLEETDYYKQMTLGQWVVNSSRLVYQLKAHNLINEIPEHLAKRTDWQYGLGVDFGFTDSDAFTVVSWLHDIKILFVNECIVKSGNDDVNTAQTIMQLAKRYDFSWIVVDGSSKKTVETLKERFQLPLEATEKINKYDFISLLNNDLQSNYIQILPQAQENIGKEMNKLIWDPKSPRKEKDGLANHACDSLLYAWRKATNWASIELKIEELTHEEKQIRWAEQFKQKSQYQMLEDKFDQIIWSSDDF